MSPPPHLASVVIDRHTHMNTEVSSHVAYDAHKYPAEAAAHYSNTAEIRTAKKKNTWSLAVTKRQQQHFLVMPVYD